MSALSFVILCCWCILFPVNEEHFQQLDAEAKAAGSEDGGNDAERGYSGEGDVAEEEEEEEDYEEEMEVAEEVEEDDDASGYDTATETETDTTETETEEEHGDKLNRLSLKNTNIRTEPKHIVFLTQLLLLFKFCHICKADNPTVEASENGTQAIMRTHCNNPKCNKEDLWYSQPQMPGLKIPAGNFLLALSILLAGGSATKVFKLFSFMGLGCVSLKTFFEYQGVSS